MKNIRIDKPKLIEDGKLKGLYSCEVYLPTRQKLIPFYDTDEIKVNLAAKNFITAYLQEKIERAEYLLSKSNIREVLQSEIDWSKKQLINN